MVVSDKDTRLNKPKVSIGLPVYNGEKYLQETLDSLLGQTFSDFELIISDNASTDGTQTICRTYAEQDERIKYHRNEVNLGAAENYNIVFQLANGKYFKWAAADDLLAPEFVDRCVKALDEDSTVVLSYSLTEEIDKDGNTLHRFPHKPGCGSPKPSERFYETVCVSIPIIWIFGLIRADVLHQTKLIGKYSGSDRPLLGEICLYGRFFEIQETLFFYRKHEEQSWGGNKSRQQQQSWYDPSRAGKITFPHWRLLGEHLHSIQRAPLSLTDKAKCYICMARWIRLHWRYLANNLILRDVKRRS